MTHRGPFQTLTFCDSVILCQSKQKASLLSCILSSLTTIFAWWEDILWFCAILWLVFQKSMQRERRQRYIFSLSLNKDMLMFACHCPFAHSRARLLRLHLSLASAVRGMCVWGARVEIHLWHVCLQPWEMRLAQYPLPLSYWT